RTKLRAPCPDRDAGPGPLFRPLGPAPPVGTGAGRGTTRAPRLDTALAPAWNVADRAGEGPLASLGRRLDAHVALRGDRPVRTLLGRDRWLRDRLGCCDRRRMHH